MATDTKKKLEELEKTINDLITSHQQLRVENERLQKQSRQLEAAFIEEKQKIKRIEEGYKELKSHEGLQRNKSIETIKSKISTLVSEIDRNVAQINAKK